MKKLVFISGAVFSSLFLISVVFKVLHWPGATILFFVGMMGMALIFIPFFAAYLFKRTKP